MSKRCSFCGKTNAFPFLRAPISWLSTAAGTVCSDDCADKARARHACESEPLQPVLEVDGWWAADGEGHVAWSRESAQDVLELLDLEVLS